MYQPAGYRNKSMTDTVLIAVETGEPKIKERTATVE